MMHLLRFKVVLILANSADPDEMQHYAEIYLGLHRLPKYTVRDYQCTKWLSPENCLEIANQFKELALFHCIYMR